jgi:hypothetical protein
MGKGDFTFLRPVEQMWEVSQPRQPFPQPQKSKPHTPNIEFRQPFQPQNRGRPIKTNE